MLDISQVWIKYLVNSIVVLSKPHFYPIFFSCGIFVGNFENVLTEVRERVGIVTLHRPKVI